MKRNADQIFNKYCKLLYKISIIMLCSEEDAYDAVQESFLKYLNTKKDFNDESDRKMLCGWLKTVQEHSTTCIHSAEPRYVTETHGQSTLWNLWYFTVIRQM